MGKNWGESTQIQGMQTKCFRTTDVEGENRLIVSSFLIKAQWEVVGNVGPAAYVGKKNMVPISRLIRDSQFDWA